MNITKEQIIDVLKKEGMLYTTAKGERRHVIHEHDFERAANKILTLLQSNDAGQPNGSKPTVSGALPLVEKLESRIKDCDCGFDDVSWGMQEGILISVREAKQLVALLRQ